MEQNLATDELVEVEMADFEEGWHLPCLFREWLKIGADLGQLRRVHGHIEQDQRLQKGSSIDL